MNETTVCKVCFSNLKKLKTDLTLYGRQNDIIIKNYPLHVCHFCGNVDISKVDIKKTIHFLNEQKKKNHHRKSL
jgi:YgiT-type zinc finger domain-containing protein